MEQRANLPEMVDKVKQGVNVTLEFVEKNMTWVSETERQGVLNLTTEFLAWYANVSELQEKQPLTEDPIFTIQEAHTKLKKVQSEAQRLTKIKKIDPIPYSSDYGKYGGYGGYDDPYMRKFYEEMYRNMSRNGTNSSDWWRNFSNFSSGNDSDYMRSYYEHMARNWDRYNGSGAGGAGAGTDGAGGGTGGANKTSDDGRTEL